MARFWTCHWQFRSWRPDVKDEGEPVYSFWSNQFLRRGVAPQAVRIKIRPQNRRGIAWFPLCHPIDPAETGLSETLNTSLGDKETW